MVPGPPEDLRPWLFERLTRWAAGPQSCRITKGCDRTSSRWIARIGIHQLIRQKQVRVLFQSGERGFAQRFQAVQTHAPFVVHQMCRRLLGDGCESAER